MFTCITCGEKFTMNFEEMIKHLTDEHKIDTKTVKCKKNMIAHFDFSNSYSSEYENIFPDGTMVRCMVSINRTKDDPMRSDENGS
jgi:DNA-directed RNA polymerase subunit N (RpoN/RPB10)